MADAMKGVTKVLAPLSTLLFLFVWTGLEQCFSTGHEKPEQEVQFARDSEDHDGVRKGVWHDGHEGGDDERRH